MIEETALAALQTQYVVTCGGTEALCIAVLCAVHGGIHGIISGAAGVVGLQRS